MLQIPHRVVINCVSDRAISAATNIIVQGDINIRQTNKKYLSKLIFVRPVYHDVRIFDKCF
jgi:hypothetical protein